MTSGPGSAEPLALNGPWSVLASSQDLVLVVDGDGRTVWRNEAATAFGALPDEAASRLRGAVESTIATGRGSRFEWGRSGPGGVEAWYDAVVTSAPSDQGPVAILVCRDMTQIKREDERLRRNEKLMVDTQGVAHLGTWEWDVTRPTATWSDELFKIYGLTPETYTPSYEAYLEMVHPDDRQRVIDATNGVFHQHIPYSHDERIFRPDGTMRYLHTWAHPILDEKGALSRLVGVCQDITDRKLAEEALQRANAELEERVDARTAELQQALRDLETFNATVSHDLRGPLTVIQIAADVIARSAGEAPSIAPQVDRIRHAVTNMSRLIADLMTLKRIAEGSLEPTNVDVEAMIAEITSEQRSAYPERDVETVVEGPLRVMMDPTLFRAVLSNLLGNAWKYTAKTAAPRIEVGRVRRSDGVALYVRDNGIGFDMTEEERLFAPFVRLTNAKAFQGAGVGLANVRRIVERHGGRVDAEGAPGKGATFFVVLPDSCWA